MDEPQMGVQYSILIKPDQRDDHTRFEADSFYAALVIEYVGGMTSEIVGANGPTVELALMNLVLAMVRYFTEDLPKTKRAAKRPRPTT